MSDRLPELLRQRALVQEHLAWLDREIVAAQGVTLVAPTSLPAPPPLASAAVAAVATPPPLPSPAALSTPDATEAILAQYQQDSVALKTDVRRGCLLYFAGALALLAVAVGIAYAFYVRRHGG